MLAIDEAADIFPMLENEIFRLKQKLDDESLDDQAVEEIARRLFRLERICHRISRALNEKRESELGREPEFIKALWNALDNGSL